MSSQPRTDQSHKLLRVSQSVERKKEIKRQQTNNRPPRTRARQLMSLSFRNGRKIKSLLKHLVNRLSSWTHFPCPAQMRRVSAKDAAPPIVRRTVDCEVQTQLFGKLFHPAAISDKRKTSQVAHFRLKRESSFSVRAWQDDCWMKVKFRARFPLSSFLPLPSPLYSLGRHIGVSNASSSL
jgi:hypothetical protein